MSSIAQSIIGIVDKRLNGLGLKPAANGAAIEAGKGVGKDTAASKNAIPDEVFVEQSRKEVTQRIESTDDPEMWVDDPVVTAVTLKSKEGRIMELLLKEPTND